MVIEPFVGMGPSPRSLAAKANGCFIVQLPRGATEYKSATRSLCRMASSPRILGYQARPHHPTAAPKATTASPHSAGWGNTIPLRDGEQNMPRGRHRTASTPSVTPNDRPDIPPAERPSNYHPWSATVGRRTHVPDPSAGTTPAAGSSRCKPSMSLGTIPCPTACATAPPPGPFRPSSISISTRSLLSCHRVATGAIER
jgi:hypothetical protein